MTTTRREWLIPTGLVLLSLVPVLAGSMRLAELSGSPEVTPDNARFVAMPLPVVVHIVSASVFCLLGAFQFHPGLRRRRPRWHRLAGRVVAPAGIAAALSGLWMASFSDLPATDGPLLEAFRLLFGSAMVAFLVLGVVAILRRDVVTHSAWMTRGYAIGQGAGTQALILGPFLVIGMTSVTARALLMGLAWVLNLAVAEWVVRRRRTATGPAGHRALGGEHRPRGRPPVSGDVHGAGPA